jgi:Holliday junction resolvase RusA-like endonuclease
MSNEELFCLVVDGLPPSANKLSKTTQRGGIYTDPAVRAYKEKVGYLAAEQMPLSFRTKQFFSLEVILFSPFLKYQEGVGHLSKGNTIDIDNTLKIAIDAIFKGCNMNDITVRKLLVEHQHYPGDFTHFIIKPLEVSSMTKYYKSDMFDVAITNKCSYCGICDILSNRAINFSNINQLDYRRTSLQVERNLRADRTASTASLDAELQKIVLKPEIPIETAIAIEELCPSKGAFVLTRKNQ